MKENIIAAIDWVKSQPIEGCVTGSCLLDYFEGQDIDIFTYDENSFRKLLFAMHYNDMFQLLEPLEKWKFEDYINKNQSSLKKLGLVSIKFKYNLLVDVNVIFKKVATNVFSVISSFDLNIICKAYDIRSKEVLDLTGNPGKIADWNRWNTAYYEPDIWGTSRLLRQLERCFKYYNRGYDTDKVVLKYIDIIDKTIEYESVFKSEDFSERLDTYKDNLKILKKVCEKWLQDHEINAETMELIKEKSKSL